MFKSSPHLNICTNFNVGKILYFYIHSITTMLAKSQNIKDQLCVLANLLYIFSPYFAQTCIWSKFSDQKNHLDQQLLVSFFFSLSKHCQLSLQETSITIMSQRKRCWTDKMHRNTVQIMTTTCTFDDKCQRSFYLSCHFSRSRLQYVTKTQRPTLKIQGISKVRRG